MNRYEVSHREWEAGMRSISIKESEVHADFFKLKGSTATFYEKNDDEIIPITAISKVQKVTMMKEDYLA